MQDLTLMMTFILYLLFIYYYYNVKTLITVIDHRLFQDYSTARRYYRIYYWPICATLTLIV